MKLNTILKLFCYLSVLYITLIDNVIAQNRTVVEVEVENNDGSSRKNKLGVKNLIKINPILFLRGDIPIYYERALSGKFSAEVGFGMTIRDYISSVTTLGGEVYQDGIDIKPNLGYSINLGARYYPSNYVYQPEGVFLGLDYRFQKYNATAENTNIIFTKTAITEQNNDVRLLLGYIKYFEENVFIEWYSGFGVRHKVYDSISLQDNGVFKSASVSSKNFLLPYLSLGFKIGVAF